MTRKRNSTSRSRDKSESGSQIRTANGGPGSHHGGSAPSSPTSNNGSLIKPEPVRPHVVTDTSAVAPTAESREESDTAASRQIQEEQSQKSEYEKKKQSIITRTIWTFVMIAGFFAALLAGHIFIILIITGIQVVSFKEVIAIANVPSRARSLRFTKTLNWYFLGTTMYYLYGESVVYYFKHIILVDKVLLPFATHHRFISFMLYVIGEF